MREGRKTEVKIKKKSKKHTIFAIFLRKTSRAVSPYVCLCSLEKLNFYRYITYMAKTVNLSALLCNYATKQESALINFKDFHDYVRRYAARSVEEQQSLAHYVEIEEESLLYELEDLSSKREIFLLRQDSSKPVIIVMSYFSMIFEKRYKEMIEKPELPFPSVFDLSKQVPLEAFMRKDARDFIAFASENQNATSLTTYCVLLPKNVPAILLPLSVPIQKVIQIALLKIRNLLKKEEFHDYFLKKMRNSNPSKEIGVRSFFSKFIQSSDDSLHNFETEKDSFYFWNQLCYFIRQDFENIKDKTSEDINILQAISIAEMWILAQKDKISAEQKKQNAIAELQRCLAKPPYFFEMDSILHFKDSKGAFIYSQLGEEGLKACLQRLTTETKNTDLPDLLVFKVGNGKRYFIYKSNVFPLCVRLANEAHSTVEKYLLDKWYTALTNYEWLDEMKDQKAFEIEVKHCVETYSPILYTLLNTNFLPVVHLEMDMQTDGGSYNIFTGTKRNSYSEILMLKNSSVLSKAKMMVPFWYTMPVVSWIARLFFKSKKSKNVPKSQAARSECTSDDISGEKSSKTGKIGSKRDVMAAAALNISREFVPVGSTIDRELDSYHEIWNKMLTPEVRRQLTDDVNSLIRDYMRKVVKTISASTFSKERVESLAETLVNTPNMKKIGEHDALFMYVQLYILRLVSNG